MENNREPQLTKKQNTWMTIKFALFSLSAGIIQFGSCFILREFTNIDQATRLDEIFGNEYGLTYFIALILSVLWNFTFNRKFTFKSAANIPIAMLKIFAFYLVFTPVSLWWTVKLTSQESGFGLHVDQLLTALLDHSVTLTKDQIGYIVLILTMVVNLITEYLYDRYVVYRKTVFTNKEGQRELSENANKSE